MFSGLRNTIIGGGIFTVHTSISPTHTHSKVSSSVHSYKPLSDPTFTSWSTGFEILHANIATGAFHDFGERFDPPKCHPKTRVAVRAEIMQWIEDKVELERVLWLYGSAGAGKSAIGQSIAETCAKLGLLFASFFPLGHRNPEITRSV